MVAHPLVLVFALLIVPSPGWSFLQQQHGGMMSTRKRSIEFDPCLFASWSKEEDAVGNVADGRETSRRRWLTETTAAWATAVMATTTTTEASVASAAVSKVTTVEDGNLSDLPPDAARSYLQYRTALQTAADFYVFELRPKLADTEEWGEVSQIFQSASARGGQGQPSRMERDFVNPMRILSLSMPPEFSEDLRTSQYQMEQALQRMSKAIAGVRRDLPVEISKDAAPQALAAWEDGRMALNSFFGTLNDATGLKGEMKVIPSSSASDYPRSPQKYVTLMKKTKLCQNRGGPTLSQTWGQLMVSGYLQDSCGIPDLDDYFFQ